MCPSVLTSTQPPSQHACTVAATAARTICACWASMLGSGSLAERMSDGRSVDRLSAALAPAWGGGTAVRA
eukprot:5503380-Prymnesium_polylepis.1